MIKNIEYKRVEIYDFFEKQEIEIPIFQRFYSWNKNHVVEIKNDIKNAMANHDKQIDFLDFIVYYENNSVKLADGQQRLVTLNILIQAINDYSSKFCSETNSKIQGFKISYESHDCNENYKQGFKLKPFAEVYKSFYDFVAANADDIEKIISVIKKQIFIFVKIVQNAKEAYDLFIKINAGGKALSKEDIVYAMIAQRAKKDKINLATVDKKNLNNITISYFKFKFNCGFHDPNISIIEIVNFLKESVVCSKEKIIEFNKILHKFNILKKEQIFYIINCIHSQPLNEVFNVIYIQYGEITKPYINRVLLPLCLFNIIMTIRKSTSNIKYLCDEIIKFIKNKDSIEAIYTYIVFYIKKNKMEITVEMFKTFLEVKILVAKETRVTNDHIKKAIFLMDEVLHTTSSNLNMSKINLEHIYPLHPSKEWDGWLNSNDNLARVTHNIGNLLLLNDKINKRIKNSFIDCKIEEYKKIINEDRNLLFELNKIDYDALKKDREEYIFQRQHKIAEYIRDNFPLGKEVLVDKES